MLLEDVRSDGRNNFVERKVPQLLVKKINYRVIFLTGPALKVLSVGDGKNPTKKVKVRVCHRENMKI